MQKVKAWLRGFLQLDARRKAVICAGIALLIVLALALCISVNMRAHIQREYASVRGQIGESLYSNLYMLMQIFDMTSVPNADVQNAILPQMKEYFIASTTLNELLGRAYGQRYTVLTEADINNISDAFAAYDAAYRDGTATDLAESNMQTCMARVRELLVTRYSEGILKAAR